jgi:hypothetical protein
MNPAFAQNAEFTINSIKIVKTSAINVELEINYNNTKLVSLYTTITAKSKDGVLFSDGNGGMPPLQIGKNLNLKASVSRPPKLDKVRTDYLQLIMYSDFGKTIINKLKFDMQIDWEALPIGDTTKERDIYAFVKSRSSNFDIHTLAFLHDFQEEDFSAIDILIDKLNDSRELSESGEWLLTQFQYALEVDSEDPQSKDARLDKWISLNKKSVGAVIAEAMRIKEKAWKLRGGIYNNNPSPLALKFFQQQIAKAETVLLLSKNFASRTPLWYELLIEINSDQGRSDAALKKLFEEGIKKFPNYRGLYVVMAKHYAPIYGNADMKAVDLIVQLAVKNTMKYEGLSNYAAVYRDVFAQQFLEFSPFENSMLNWSTMKTGYMNLIKRHPHKYNRNSFAAYSCRAEDSDAFKIAMILIGNDLEKGYWPENYSPDVCNIRFPVAKNPS